MKTHDDNAGVTFEQSLLDAATVEDLVEQFERRFGMPMTLPDDPAALALLVDRACADKARPLGEEEATVEFIRFVHDYVWLPRMGHRDPRARRALH